MDIRTSQNFESQLKFSLPSVEVNEEPILVGCTPETKSDGSEAIIPHSKLIHLGEHQISADYFPNSSTPKMQRARYVRRFVLSTIKFKKVKIPLHSQVISCEIIYRDFSIKELRLRCKFPYSVNLDQEIIYHYWVTDESPQSYIDEDYYIPLNLPSDEEHYFVYHRVDLSLSAKEVRQRILFSWKTPEKGDEHKICGKALWTLPC